MTKQPPVPAASANPSRLLRINEVVKRVGISVSSIYDAISKGRFPKPRRIYGRTVGWKESEIEEFIGTRDFADATEV